MNNKKANPLIDAIAEGDLKKIAQYSNNKEHLTPENFRAAFLLLCEREQVKPRCKYLPGLKESDWPAITAGLERIYCEGADVELDKEVDDKISEILFYLHHASNQKRISELAPYLNK